MALIKRVLLFFLSLVGIIVLLIGATTSYGKNEYEADTIEPNFRFRANQDEKNKWYNDFINNLKKLIEIFEVQDIQKAGAVFDIERLNFVNQAHIANMKADSLMQELESYLSHE